MKPKTKIQQEVWELHKQLPPLTARQKDFAKNKSHELVGYYSCGVTWCANCGNAHGKHTPFEDDVKDMVCPSCGARIRIIKSTKRKHDDRQYCTFVTTFKGWQVVRHFATRWFCCKGDTPESWFAEAVQVWIKPGRPKVVIARSVNQSLYRYDCWNFSKPMEIRRPCSISSYYQYDRYEIWANFIYPYMSVLPIVRRNGFNLEAVDKVMPPASLIEKLLVDQELEYLVKTKQYALAHHFKHKKNLSIKNWEHAIKICLRNRYKIEDAPMWEDYMGLLDYFHLDTHNAYYVCPKNLKEAHDKLMKRKIRKEELEKAVKNRKDAEKWEKDYSKTKGAYFGICFGNEKIQIAVITSVADIAEEGCMMHHCVYASEYFKKENSLILSARDVNGNRLETIELDLRTLQVVQSRGKFNQQTPYHDEIVELVKSNIGKFQLLA